MSISGVSSNTGMIQAAYNRPSQVDQKAAVNPQNTSTNVQSVDNAVEKTIGKCIDVYA
jgi:hypothetical protein